MESYVESRLSVMAKEAYDTPREGNALHFRQDQRSLLYTKNVKTSKGYEFTVNIGVKLNTGFKNGGKVAHEIKQINDSSFVMQIMNKLSLFFDEAHKKSHFSLMPYSLSGTLNMTFDQLFQLKHDRKADITLRSVSRERRGHLLRAFKKEKSNIPENEQKKFRKFTQYIEYSKNFEIHGLGWPHRKLAVADRIYFQQVKRSFINQLILFKEQHGYKPTVFLFDDSVSGNALTFRMIVNQIAPYANVIVFAFLME